MPTIEQRRRQLAEKKAEEERRSKGPVDGEQGIQGPEGPIGPQGEEGERGPIGPKGDKGDKGDTGREGRDGQPGAKGEQGPIGHEGHAGKDGHDGKDGKDCEDCEECKETRNWAFGLGAGRPGADGAPGTTLHSGLTDVTADQHHAEAHSGSVHTDPAVAADVGTAGSAGTGTNPPASDNHIHRGTSSVSQSGSPALYADLEFDEGNYISLVQTGQTIAVHMDVHDLLASDAHGDAGIGVGLSLGALIYGNSTPTWTPLAGNITTTKKFLAQTGTGAISAVPAWDTIADGDVPATHSGSAHHAAATASGAHTVSGQDITAVAASSTLAAHVE